MHSTRYDALVGICNNILLAYSAYWGVNTTSILANKLSLLRVGLAIAVMHITTRYDG
jgi:hypothetical protein